MTSTLFENVGFTDAVVSSMPKDEFINAHMGLWGNLPDDQKHERLSQVHDICTAKCKIPTPKEAEDIDHEDLDAE